MIKKSLPLISINLTLLTFAAFMYVLYIGASIIIPVILALLLSFIILSLSHAFARRGLHKHLSLIAAFGVMSFVIYLITQIINANIEQIVQLAPGYQEKFTRIITDILIKLERYGFESQSIIESILLKLDFGWIATWTASLLGAIVKNAGLVVFFTLFILLESNAFKDKLILISWWERSSFFKITAQISEDIKSYFLIKTIASLSVGLLSFIIMYFFGIDFFLFWAFIIFLLNYIPSIGSIIAVFFPVVFSLIQFESFYITGVFLVLMVAAQILIWNILEPRLLWNKLNLSPLVILISLIFWGTLWWPIGMLLSVPIMVMVNIVLAHIPATRPIAILLSEKGMIKFEGGNTKMWKFNLKKMKKILKK